MENLSKNKIKWIRSLRLKKNRQAEKKFIVEGDKMVRELVEQFPELVVLTASSEFNFEHQGEHYFTDDKTIEQISSLNTPNKSLAVVSFPVFKQVKGDLILVLDGIQDPGNLGTIIRTADWFGIDQIVCSTDTVDVFNSKVIQSSMGSIFHVPISYTNVYDFIQSKKTSVYGTLLDGQNIHEAEINNKGIIVMGNEGNGISDRIKPLITHPIKIPGFGKAESLNVAIATGVVLSIFKNNE